MPEDKVLAGFYYTEKHEWASVENSGAKMGITDYAQDQLGDIVFVELPESGDKAEQGSEIATVESIKAVSEVCSPLSGEVKKPNEDLEDAPELLNSDPYGAGWICVLEPSNLDEELENLMDSEDYEKFLESEG